MHICILYMRNSASSFSNEGKCQGYNLKFKSVQPAVSAGEALEAIAASVVECCTYKTKINQCFSLSGNTIGSLSLVPITAVKC